MCEWPLSSAKTYRDPFNDVELDVVFTDPSGDVKRVPAFWGGEHTWRVRYASPETGRHCYRTECSDTANADLHGKEGEFDVQPYQGGNPLLRHGPLRVTAGGRHLEHADGTSFFWLGDTWWWGLVSEFKWPGEFQELLADRKRKGFNLIQIVAGYVPAMQDGDQRGGNEAGLPWGADYRSLNPGYFDLADLRIDCLVRNGFVPCIFGSWGDWLMKLGLEKMKKHWRYLIARYGAYPVVWSLCGEVFCLYPPNEGANENENEQRRKFLREAWGAVARYVAEVDPYHHPLTAHPVGGSDIRDCLDGDVPLTVAMLQTGHTVASLPDMIKLVTRAREMQPLMPVINGEPIYESIFGSGWQDVQRFALWTCLLAGAAGHTYGAAEGCWHIYHRGREPISLTTGPWGDYEDWRDIAAFPGSGQMQHARRLLERYDWQRFEQHPEWLELWGGTEGMPEDGCFIPRAAGIPGQVRVVYTGLPSYVLSNLKALRGLEPGVSYRAHFFNPRSGTTHDIGPIRSEAGQWQPPKSPDYLDWVIVLETQAARAGRQG